MPLVSKNPQTGGKMYYTGNILSIRFEKNKPDAKYFADRWELKARVRIAGEEVDWSEQLQTDMDWEKNIRLDTLLWDTSRFNTLSKAFDLKWDASMKPSQFFKALDEFCRGESVSVPTYRFGTKQSQKGAVYLSGVYSNKPPAHKKIDSFDMFDDATPVAAKTKQTAQPLPPPDDLDMQDDIPF